MNNLSIFQFEGQGIRTTEDGQFSVYDVLVAFGVSKKSSCRTTLKRILDKNPEVVQNISDAKFPGRGQRETPVATQETCEEILRIVGKHPEQEIVTSDKFYPKTESQVIKVLISAFQDCQPCPQFFCQGYRIDLYLALPRIVIEVDEYGHKDYSSDKEKHRERSIKSALGCSFIRFDPYSPDFNLGDVIFEIRGLIR